MILTLGLAEGLRLEGRSYVNIFVYLLWAVLSSLT